MLAQYRAVAVVMLRPGHQFWPHRGIPPQTGCGVDRRPVLSASWVDVRRSPSWPCM